jgi:outer membrane PBP1 activator LpoA protein
LLGSLTEASASAPDKALFNLNALDTATLDDFERGLFLRTLGRLQARGRDPAALLNLLNAELFPMPTKRRTALTHLVWESLRDNVDPALDRKVDMRNPHLAGWLVLREDVRAEANDPAALNVRLAEWRLRFPQHPANELLIDEILEWAEEQSAPVQKVALLLPLEGPLATYAAALRDGYLLARLAGRDTKLEVGIYSAEAAGATAAYQRAAADGAQLVVGPLDKPGVDALAKLPARPVPVLALNNIQQAGIAGLTQFGLAPEDEAADLARRSWADGHRRMACIVPESVLGERVLKAFAAAWTASGGVIIEQSRYGNSVPEYKNAIRRSFSLAQSEARAASLRRLLRRQLVFVARARPDLDAIMLVAEPVSARQIMPQFRYLGVDHLPIYATALVYGGAVNPRADQDLDGIRFAAMPWVLGTSDRELRAVVGAHWRHPGYALQPFFALGVDAYRLTRALPTLRGSPGVTLAGATGALRIDAESRIHRALEWAVFRGGAPRLLEPEP